MFFNTYSTCEFDGSRRALSTVVPYFSCFPVSPTCSWQCRLRAYISFVVWRAFFADLHVFASTFRIAFRKAHTRFTSGGGRRSLAVANCGRERGMRCCSLQFRLSAVPFDRLDETSTPVYIHEYPTNPWGAMVRTSITVFVRDLEATRKYTNLEAMRDLTGGGYIAISPAVDGSRGHARFHRRRIYRDLTGGGYIVISLAEDI